MSMPVRKARRRRIVALTAGAVCAIGVAGAEIAARPIGPRLPSGPRALAAGEPRRVVPSDASGGAAFVANVEPRMTAMHDAMHDAMPNGRTAVLRSADAVFAAAMTAHHQGAIAMAQAELRYGRNERLRRLAQEIIVTQQQEIVAMRRANEGIAVPPVPAASRTSNGITHRDRVYAAEQFSNTVSVTDPADNRLLGVIRLGDPQPGNLSPLYRGQLLVHGLGFSPDHATLAVVAIGTNSVSFIETATNTVKHVTYVGRAPHEAFFTPDGAEVWVTVRGENYVAVLDGRTYAEKMRITVPNGPGMQIFSPDGRYGYVCSSFTPETVVIEVRTHRIVGRVPQASPFCPNIAATPDGRQVWLTLKDVGKTMVFDARPPFAVLRTLDTGPITNHVNFARTAEGTFAYVTVGGRNEVLVYRTTDFAQVATIRVGALPHGVWPSGDGSRMYVGLENGDALAAIDTRVKRVVATIPIGQAPQALVYVTNAVPAGDTRAGDTRAGAGGRGLEPLGVAGQAAHLSLAAFMGGAPVGDSASAPTSVTLFDQGIAQVLQAAVTGLQPNRPYVLALSREANGGEALEPLAAFTTNPAGASGVLAVGPIRQIVHGATGTDRRYLVVVSGTPDRLGPVVQVQVP